MTLAAVAALALAGLPALAAEPTAKMKAILDQFEALKPTPIETLSAPEARKQPPIAQAAMDLMKKDGMKPEPIDNIDNMKIDLGNHDMAVRVYQPAGKGPYPVILYIHGGGWVIATLDTYDATPRALCNGAAAVVVSIEYRKAPEDKFPAAHEDAFGAYQWILKNAAKIKGDPSKVAVVGESAGGNMAVSVSLMAKEAGIPLPVHEVLVYPVVDATGMDTPSKLEYVKQKPLSTPMLPWFVKNLVKSEADTKDPHLSLMMAGDALKSLPPTTIIAAELDPLMSEGKMFAEALEKAGVKVNYKLYQGVTHEFFGMGAVLPEAKEAEALALSDLKKAFGM